MKNVMVLGGNGFIGTFLSKRLQNEYNVIIYDRNEPSYSFNGTFIKGNFVEEINFFEILKDNNIDIVFHLLSTTVPTENLDCIEDEIIMNVIPSIKLFKAMIKAGVKKLIFASSGGTVYGEYSGTPHKCEDSTNPISSYGVQKNMIESYINLFNLYYSTEFIIARISNPYGVWAQKNRFQGVIPIFINNLINDSEITIYGETIRDYIFIDDVIDALVLLKDYTGTERKFNIGTGIGHTTSEIVEMLESKLKKNFVKINYEKIRKCDVKENILDISNTISELKWMPKYNIEDGINNTINKIL